MVKYFGYSTFWYNSLPTAKWQIIGRVLLSANCNILHSHVSSWFSGVECLPDTPACMTRVILNFQKKKKTKNILLTII